MNLNEDPLALPANVLENALGPLAKKTAATVWGQFKKLLSTASEPLLRKNMGERYVGNPMAGCLIWLIGTVIAAFLPSLRSAGGIISEILGWYPLAHFFKFWLFTWAAGGALIVLNYRYGAESLALMAKFRADGTPYHTMSRGVPRWGDNNGKVLFGMIGALFLFNLPVGILLVASCSMSSKLAAEQQAAIYSRYLDALDQKIEQEYLEDAILGKCPTEITQLHKPLPADMNSDLRTNIAAAAVGKKPKIIAKAPKPKTPVPV